MSKIRLTIKDKKPIKLKLETPIIELTPPLENIIITPSKEEQTFKSNDYYGYDEIKVNAVTSNIDENMKAENIKKDVEILGVTGILESVNVTEVRITPTSEEQTITPEEPYNGFDKVIVEAQSGVSPDEYFNTTVNSSNVSYFGSKNMVKKIPTLEIDPYLTNMGMMFFQMSEIESVPYMDTSKVTNMTNMFGSCYKLVNIPLYDTSNVTNMNGIFLECHKLKNPPALNTSKVTNTGSMFATCIELEEIPFYDISKSTNTSAMFNNCRKLKTIPQLDMSKATTTYNLFNGCSALESLPKLDFSSTTNISGMFTNVTGTLTDVAGFDNLGKAYLTTRAENYSSYSLIMGECSALTLQSAINILDSLYDIASKGCKRQRVDFHNNVLTLLQNSPEGQQALANADAKGWNVI